ncbi:MAG TPA: hypothetical protein VK995_02275, partial [Oceanipulchritudo sp.]|nr:hypothetical protein [Oceanipulchritudo sp.]
MSQKILSDLTSLCWVNPFSVKRGEIEQRLLGEAFRPISQTGGRGIFSPNLDFLLIRCRELLQQGPVHPESAELAAFVIYHELADDIDGLISEPKNTRRAWKKYLACWDHYYPGYAGQPQAFDQATLFALFYQIRRAFTWIYNYVIGSSPDASRLRERIWESIFSHDLKRYVSGFHREMNDIHSLITGPSGSGKGLVARAIGMSRFIPFDLAKEAFTADPEAAYFSVNVAVLPEQ